MVPGCRLLPGWALGQGLAVRRPNEEVVLGQQDRVGGQRGGAGAKTERMSRK